jgi:hypothetical protein
VSVDDALKNEGYVWVDSPDVFDVVEVVDLARTLGSDLWSSERRFWFTREIDAVHFKLRFSG